MPFAVLAGGTLGRILDLAGSLMKVSFVVAARQYANAHQKLDSLESNMTKSVVPAQQFFFGLGEVEISIIHGSDGCI